MAKKLKDCPFCGSSDDYDVVHTAKLVSIVDGAVSYCVMCEHCGVDGPEFVNEEEAIAAWNRRDLEEKHREQLVQELEDLKNREDAYGHPSTKYGIQLAIEKIKEVGA